ncbi:hypothetical protein J7U46_16720 [Pelomonas sp. V22]|uniref:hypothetical protein n=1 Tax=Pelomonas sp. V22 TaxID=2822139 RepID=UPI0024A94758|nr:hypothetical protein [Pelomonas sp. V22]MDI4634706.1 hypothetical protein [Pelomonas sp. V22]
MGDDAPSAPSLAKLLIGDEELSLGKSLKALIAERTVTGESRYVQFAPPEIARRLDLASYPTHPKQVEALKALTLADLRAENNKWLREPVGWARMVSLVWEINCEFTRRGIGPAWREIPEFIHAGAPAPPRAPGKPRALSDQLKLNLLKRWIDLEWLRTVLGPNHATAWTAFAPLFDPDPAVAMRGYFAATRIKSRDSNGRYGPESNRKVLFGLSVPTLLRFSLVGLVDRDRGELRTNARRRVRDVVKPRLEGLADRATYPLKPEQLASRLIQAEAIEMAAGNPSDAAQIYAWMTGKTISRQSMHAARKKIAEQCELRTRAWHGGGT